MGRPYPEGSNTPYLRLPDHWFECISSVSLEIFIYYVSYLPHYLLCVLSPPLSILYPLLNTYCLSVY